MPKKQSHKPKPLQTRKKLSPNLIGSVVAVAVEAVADVQVGDVLLPILALLADLVRPVRAVVVPVAEL